MKRIALAAFAVAAIAAALVLVHGRRVRTPVEQILDESQEIGLTVVPSQRHGPNVIFLVRDPAHFFEPTRVDVLPKMEGVVRAARLSGLVREVNAVQFGQYELRGDPAVISQLLRD